MRNVLRQLSILRAALAPTLLAAAAALTLLTSAANAQLLNAVPAQPSALAPGTFSQTPRHVLDGTATFVEHYDPTRMLRVSISLTAPHPVEEAQFLVDVQDRNSPTFHRFLAPDAWNERFGPSVQDEQAVVDWATSQGFTIVYRYNSRLLVDLEAPVSVIENAFNLHINRYQTYDEFGLPGKVEFANDRDPILPSQLTHTVLAVLGLNSFSRVHPVGSMTTGVDSPDYTPGPAVGDIQTDQRDAASQGASTPSRTQGGPAGSTPIASFFTPQDDFSAAAYDYDALHKLGHCCNPLGNPNNSPKESSIAVSAFGDVSFTDVSEFQKGFSYLSYNLVKISVNGGYTCNNSKAPDNNCQEASYDTEWSIATGSSQGSSATTARVYLYEGNSGDYVSNWTHMLDDSYARVMTQSWACAEDQCGSGYVASADQTLSSMAGEGWTLLSSSGDRGSTGSCSDELQVLFPASSWNVIASGGTQLALNLYDPISNDLFVSEPAWTGSNKPGSCAGNGGGSTGGLSNSFKVPPFQSGMGFPSRAVPDLSLNANSGENFYVFGGWIGYVGTSIVNPKLAGFFAQENAYLLSLGDICGSSGTAPCAPVGNANYPIYEEALNHDAYHDPFYDVTSGCGTNDITAKYPNLKAWCAKPGYDLVTGWGSVNMLQLAWALNWRLAYAYGVPYVEYSGPTTNKWYNSNQNVSWTVKDYNGGGEYKGTGIAGFNQGWDSVPNDSTTEPHGQSSLSTDTFYTGPQFPNATTGCLALASGEDCSGGVTQGCHTAHVQGWNNQGIATGDVTYGPVCYDTVAPTVSLNTNPYIFSGIWTRSSVSMSLSATDPGGNGASGVAHTYYGLDNFTCQIGYQGNCSVYTGAVNITAQGQHTFTFFTEDNAGNYSQLGSFAVWIDETAPLTKIGLSGVLSDNQWQSAVTVNLTATDNAGGAGVKHTTYQLDGALTQLYTGAFKVTTPGSHSITFESDDNAGNAEVPQTTTFVIESPVATTLTVTSPATPTATTVTLTATLAPSLSGGTPTGSITFYNGTTKLSIVPLSGLTASSPYILPVGTSSLHAVYSGATYYAASTSPVVTVTTTTTTLTSNLNPATFGQDPAFVAVVKAAAGASPSGTVTFYDGATALATETLASDGDAILLNYPLNVGTHQITAIYNGAGTDLTSASSTVSQVINILPTTLTLKSSLNPANVGSTVTFSTTIGTSSFVIATGSVTFKDGTTTLATVPLAGSNGVTYATSTLPPATHSITAVYSGSINESASTSAPLTEIIAANKTTTTLTTDLNPAQLGYTVLLNATVTAVTGAAPTGTIAFKDGTTTLATLAINAAGVATYAPSNLTVGTHSITATYTGDTSDATSTSTVIAQKITAASTATTLTSSLNPSTFGKSVTFQATVAAGSGAVPTGTVTFKDGSALLGTETLVSAKASFTTSTLAAGSHNITAVYTADTNDATSTSAVLAQVVDAAATSTTLASSLASAGFGSPVTFTTSVKAATGTIPTGTVTFLDGTTTLGSETLAATGAATFSTSTLAVGAHSITVVYKGTTSDATSTSPAFTETIKPSTSTTTLTSSANPAAFGASVTFTAKVAATTGSVPTGTVTFKYGATILGTGTLTAGTATFKTSSLPAGSDLIVAVYTADTDDATSTSAVLVQTITAAATATSIASPLSSASFGTQVTFAASVKATTGTIPTGTVTFKDGTTTLATETLGTTGSVSFSTSTLAVGAHSITVVYKGTTSDATSTSLAFTENIRADTTTTTLTSSLNPSTPGVAVTFTAKVTVPTGPVPTGTVTFKDGTTVLGTANLASGSATFKTTTLTTASHTIAAVYAGSTDDATSTSANLTQIVH